jgi:ribosome-associated protein
MEYETQIEEPEISKSQLKRDSHALQGLGKKLAALSADQLARVPLDEPVLEAIALAHRIQNKRSALKRHYQFLGKLLRARDTDAIFAALDELHRESQQSIKLHHRAETWRDRIVAEGDDAINEFVSQWTPADRQKLRQLWRNHNNAPNDAKKIQHSRLIYKEIKRSLGA